MGVFGKLNKIKVSDETSVRAWSHAEKAAACLLVAANEASNTSLAERLRRAVHLTPASTTAETRTQVPEAWTYADFVRLSHVAAALEAAALELAKTGRASAHEDAFRTVVAMRESLAAYREAVSAERVLERLTGTESSRGRRGAS